MIADLDQGRKGSAPRRTLAWLSAAMVALGSVQLQTRGVALQRVCSLPCWCIWVAREGCVGEMVDSVTAGIACCFKAT